METLLTTAEAAQIAGVGVTSIKRWADEDRIRAVRTPGGHRRIVKADLLEFILESSGGTVPEAAPGDAGSRWATRVLKEDVISLQGSLLQTRGRLGAWYAVVDEVSEGLRELGRRWLNGEISALEEHVGTERLARALASISDAQPRTRAEPVCLLTCPPGEEHTLGLSLLQLCLGEAGWDVLWVGRSTPVEDLSTMVGAGRIQMVAMTVSAAPKDAGSLARFVAEVGSACERKGIPLVVGGSGAWPDPLPYGRRFRSMREFAHFLSEMG